MKEFLLNHGLDLSFKEYREVDAMSASFINSFATSGVAVLRDEIAKKSSAALSLGSAVDKYLLNREHFYDEYVVVPEPLTGQLGDLYNYIRNSYYPVYEKIPSIDETLDLATELNLFGNIKDPVKRKEKLTPEFVAQIFNIPNLVDKIPISENDELWIKLTAAYIKTNLNDELYSDDKFRINHYQLLREIDGVRIKGEIDQLEVDFKNKVITITDIKTGEEPAHQFEKAFYKYRYWMQCGLYMDLILDLIKDDAILSTFDVRCKYIYISKTAMERPVVYHVTGEWYDLAKYGWVGYSGMQSKGFIDIIREIKWHVDNQKFDYPYEVYQNNNMFIINPPAILL